jgi:uncharacterized cysteine cluster protein YcgN (CxxCxxCC family)
LLTDFSFYQIPALDYRPILAKSRRIVPIIASSLKPPQGSNCTSPEEVINEGTMTEAPPFWKSKALSQMSRKEWESLCDGCGRCCLNKLEDEDTGNFLYTRAACKLLDLKTCQCSDYPNRAVRVPDCVSLTPKNVGELGWLPKTCAYRLLDEGKSLAWWHPLVSGRPETVAEAGIMVTGEAYSEDGISVEQLVDHLWKLPKAKRKKV